MPEFNLEEVPEQKGRIAIVTGANVGLGYETALGLASKKIKVVMACRNLEKARNAKVGILNQVPEANLEIIQLDLNSLESVRSFAAEYLKEYDKLDLLINNAGIMIPPYQQTKEGFESQFGVNYLAHFLLTNLLIPALLNTEHSRVVSLSSIAHKHGKIDFGNLNAEKKYSRTGAYSQSKLACLMFAYELQRRLEKAGKETISVAAHPGVSNTSLIRYLPGILQGLNTLLAPIFTQSAKEGAQPSLYAALGKDMEGGDYCGPDGKKEWKGKATKVKSTRLSHDQEVAKKLWEVSEKLTGEKFTIA
jgi:NAD(P)-dependent dehydrogenase (short-subunit alcohol dehydrogenase family)